MRRKTGIWLAVVLLGAALGGYWLWQRDADDPPAAPIFTAPVPVAAKAPAAPPAPAAEPEIRHPVEAEPEAPALPDPDHADAALFKALGKVLGKKLVALVVPDELIRRIVATVDNLPRQQLPAAIVPLKRTPGAFATAGSGETLTIAASNAQRYAPQIKLIAAVDSGRLVALYREFYPLFQRAYAQLGYPKAYFNDRLVEAIDDLLAAPDVEPGARLVQPKVLYEYADPELQARSAGQKIMMRVGPDNAAALKAKLKEIRQLVARAPAKP
jgi:hypothetical protein